MGEYMAWRSRSCGALAKLDTKLEVARSETARTLLDRRHLVRAVRNGAEPDHFTSQDMRLSVDIGWNCTAFVAESALSGFHGYRAKRCWDGMRRPSFRRARARFMALAAQECWRCRLKRCGVEPNLAK
jgi:hypothetical protein